MRALVAVLVVAGASITAFTISCGPSCLDDRCSLKAATPQTTRVDYTKPTSSGTVSVGSGSAAPVATAGSGSATPPPIVATAGSGSAKPAAGSGSNISTPPPKPEPVATSASWELYTGDQYKMHVVSKATFSAGAKVTLELVKAPTKTPFVVTLAVTSGGVAGNEAVWNECPENKIRCESAGVKTHALKKSGQVLIQAGVNWTVTSVVDEAAGTLATWTHNYSREVFSLRLSK